MTLRGFIVWLGARELLFKKSSSLYLCHHSHFSSADLLACFSSAPQGTGILGYWLLISKLFNTSLNFLTIHGLAMLCSTIMYIFIFIFSLPPNLGKPLVLTKESLFTYFLLQLKNFSENCKLPLSLSISLNGC